MSRGGHARHQADEAFGSEDRPGRYTYGGDSGPGAVSAVGSGPVAGNVDWNPSEHTVPEEDQTSRPMEGVTGPEPLGHSVMKVHLDSRSGRNELKPERSEHPVPDDTPCRVVGFYDNQTVSDPLEHSRTGGSGDPVLMPAPSELAEHLTSVGHSVRQLKLEPSEHPAPDSAPRGVVGFF